MATVESNRTDTILVLSPLNPFVLDWYQTGTETPSRFNSVVRLRTELWQHPTKDLAELITRTRQAPGGGAAWRQIVEERAASLRRALEDRRISKVKYLRFLRGLTQKELANQIGTKQSNIARYERLSYKPGRATIEKLARALNVEAGELL